MMEAASPRKKLITLAVGILTFVLLIFMVVNREDIFFWSQVLIYGVPDSKDFEEVTTIGNAVITLYPFQNNSVSEPGRPPVFVEAGSRVVLTRPTKIVIYGVTNPADQEKILLGVRQLIADRKLKPVNVNFFDHENWITSGNVSLRGEETLLRSATIRSRKGKD